MSKKLTNKKNQKPAVKSVAAKMAGGDGPPPNSVATALLTTSNVIDAAFALQMALFTQGQNAARWDEEELHLLRDERMETGVLATAVDQKRSQVDAKPQAQLSAVIEALDAATVAVKAVRSINTLGPAIVLVNTAQRLARLLLQ